MTFESDLLKEARIKAALKRYGPLQTEKERDDLKKRAQDTPRLDRMLTSKDSGKKK
jgi:hypothetical protein